MLILKDISEWNSTLLDLFTVCYIPFLRLLQVLDNQGSPFIIHKAHAANQRLGLKFKKTRAGHSLYLSGGNLTST